MSRHGLRLRNVAQLVARELRDKLLILLELRDFPEIAHACVRARGAANCTKSPMNFRDCPETQATSMTYRATVAQLSRNHTISRATRKEGGVLWG
jgi:hypothetical protein